MTDSTPDDVPIFPTQAPAVFSDPEATKQLFAPVLDRLAAVVEVDPAQLGGPTACDDFDVAELRRHVLGWLQFFAAALNDPAATAERLDPTSWQLGEGDSPADIVRTAAADIATAIDAGAADELVLMSASRMAGTGVLGMALGEYIVHGWDLATATGRPVEELPDEVSAPALQFLETMVAPEYRGPDTGFFDAEVEPPADASAFVRLLCFAGRDPQWRPAT